MHLLKALKKSTACLPIYNNIFDVKYKRNESFSSYYKFLRSLIYTYNYLVQLINLMMNKKLYFLVASFATFVVMNFEFIGRYADDKFWTGV